MGNLIRLLGIVIALVSAAGCQRSDSATELYKFSRLTKDVHVQVNVEYKLNANGGPVVQTKEQNFILNAYLAGDENIQVAIGRAGTTPTTDMQLTLNETQLTFDAVVRIPVDAEPGENGFTFFFAMKEQNNSLWRLIRGDVESSTVKNLEALKGGVQPGLEASANQVHLSLATTLAYRVTRESGLSGSSQDVIAAYEKLMLLLKARLETVEANIDPATTPDLATYASAVMSGAKYEILKDQNFQGELTDIVQAAISAAPNGQDGLAAPDTAKPDLVKLFSDTLKNFAEEVKSTLASSESAESKIFKQGIVETSAVVEATNYTNVAFAPSFTFKDLDSDTTLKGTLALTAPKRTSGATTYKIYFGGDTANTRKLKLFGQIESSASPLQLDVPDQTPVPKGATRFYLFIERGNEELDAPSSTAINNWIKQEPPTIVIKSPAPSQAGWTNDAQVEIEVANDATATHWCLIEDSPKKPSAAQCGQGSWLPARPTSFTFLKGDGLRKIHAWLKFRDNIVSDAGTHSIQVDTIPPPLAIASPADNAFIGPTSQVTLQCEVSSQLTFDVDDSSSQILDCDTATKVVSPSWGTTEGNRTFNAKSKDKAGNETTTLRTYVYDKTPPDDGNLATPAAAITIMGASYDITWSAASDSTAGLAAAPYLITYHNHSDCGTPRGTAVETNLTTHTMSGIADGTTTYIKVRAKDAVGNTSDGRCSYAVQRRATPPPTTIGDNGTGTFDTTNHEVPLTVTSMPAGWEVCASTSQSNTPTESVCGGSGWVNTAPANITLPLVEQTYQVYVWYKAPDGVLTTAVTRAVWLNLNPPAPAFTSPADNSHQTSTMAVTVDCETGTPVNFSGGVTSKTVDCINGIATTTLTTTAPDGVKSVTVSQTDNHNRTGTDTINITRDSVAPVVSITAPAANQISELNGTIEITVSCEGGLYVVFGGHAASSTAMCPSPADTLTYTVYLMEPDGNRTVTVTQTDLAGNTTTASRVYERFYGRIMTRNVMVEPGVHKEFYMDISAANANNWTYSLDENSVVTDLATANGRLEVLAGNNFRYTPNNNFVGTEIIRVYAKDTLGHIIYGDVQFEVDNTISTVQPVLSVRGTACMMCHANIQASMITDFGYGSPYYGGGSPTVNGSFSGNNFYGDHAENWRTAKISGQLVVPAGSGSDPLPNNYTPLTYLRSTASRDHQIQTPVVERDDIYIGAPSPDRLRQLSGLHPGDVVHTAFFKSDGNSPNLSGLLHNAEHDFYYNDPATPLRCYGDLAIDGVLLLRDLKLETDDAGCRIYTTMSLFVEGPITYELLPAGEADPLDATNPGRHLQLSSAQSINLGLGSARLPSDGASGNCHENATVDGKLSSMGARYLHGNESKTMHTRLTGKDMNKTHENNLDIIGQAERIPDLRDAQCHYPDTSFERILINAPIVMSRYKGDMKGMVVAEVALFALGSFKFEYDTVFDGKSLLPLLSRADWIRIGEKPESPVSTITSLRVGSVSDAQEENPSLKTINPAFERGTLNYSATVSNGETMVKVRAWADSSDATVMVDGGQVHWGELSTAVPLSVGPNAVEVESTSEDGNNTSVYTITVNRLPENDDASLQGLAVSSGTLIPAFSPSTTAYTVNVTNDTTSLNVTATMLAVTGQYYIQELDWLDHLSQLQHHWYGSGNQSGSVDLNVGANTITIKVRALDNITFETYTLTVNRAGGV